MISESVSFDDEFFKGTFFKNLGKEFEVSNLGRISSDLGSPSLYSSLNVHEIYKVFLQGQEFNFIFLLKESVSYTVYTLINGFDLSLAATAWDGYNTLFSGKFLSALMRVQRFSVTTSRFSREMCRESRFLRYRKKYDYILYGEFLENKFDRESLGIQHCTIW